MHGCVDVTTCLVRAPAHGQGQTPTLRHTSLFMIHASQAATNPTSSARRSAKGHRGGCRRPNVLLTDATPHLPTPADLSAQQVATHRSAEGEAADPALAHPAAARALGPHEDRHAHLSAVHHPERVLRQHALCAVRAGRRAQLLQRRSAERARLRARVRDGSVFQLVAATAGRRLPSVLSRTCTGGDDGIKRY